MPIEAAIQAHHKLAYSQNVMMVAQQKRNPLMGAVTEISAKGEAMSASDMFGQVEYLQGEDRSRRNYISMENGILDIDAVLAGAEASACLLPHSPQWFSLVSVPYAFNSDAGADPPRWLAYLDRVLESDPERIAILQAWAGYLLLPNTDQQGFLVSEGDGGNGKSVAEAGLTAMLGVENVANVPLEVFGVRFQLTHTIGKLANFCGDAGEIDKVAEGDRKSVV
jgi:phage/plasmid-associated DNA primase